MSVEQMQEATRGEANSSHEYRRSELDLSVWLAPQTQFGKKLCENCGEEHFLDAPCDESKRPNYELEPDERHSEIPEAMREDMENKRYNCLSHRLQFGMKRRGDGTAKVAVGSVQVANTNGGGAISDPERWGLMWQELNEVDSDSDCD